MIPFDLEKFKAGMIAADVRGGRYEFVEETDNPDGPVTTRETSSGIIFTYHRNGAYTLFDPCDYDLIGLVL